MVEAVIIPAPSESRSDRVTVCISSQVGCAMNCQFCFTGRMGLKSNLTTEQIVEQVSLFQSLLVPRIVDSSWQFALIHLTTKHVKRLLTIAWAHPLALLSQFHHFGNQSARSIPRLSAQTSDRHSLSISPES